MRLTRAVGTVRRPAVAGSFYPADPVRLEALVAASLGEPSGAPASFPSGILVPHAGLIYSGAVAAAGWRLLAGFDGTVVILGTNHAAPISGVAVFDGVAWATPLGQVAIEAGLGGEIAALDGFFADSGAHAREHSIEVQLPFLQVLAPAARMVPLAVSAGVGRRAIAAGTLLGELLAARRAAGDLIVLAISTDMAHYPPAGPCAAITATLVPFLVALDPGGLAGAEAAVARSGRASCGMCGIEPALTGLAALTAMGVAGGRLLAAATSADAGGDRNRTVGYCAVAFA